MNENDAIQKFLFDDVAVRGELVRINTSFKAILSQHEYPGPLSLLLGEVLAAGVLLAATIKHQGSLTIQIQGNGPITLLLAQCDNELHIRGLAKWKEELLTDDHAPLFKDAKLAVTIDSKGEELPYQAIVDFEGDNLAASFENYFEQSEQLPTLIYLAVDNEQAVGMLLQRIPGKDEYLDDFQWEEIYNLSRTITTQELLTLSNEEVLHRLFHQHSLRLYDREPVIFRCSCSIEKMENAICVLEYEEVVEHLKEFNVVEVICEFCNHKYHFDAVDVERIYKQHGSSVPPSETQH